jgi:hypothetical protein
MKIKHLALATLVAIAGLGMSCSSSDSESNLSPSLVKNPATASAEANSHQLAVMRFTEPKKNFGDVVQGQTIDLVYEFVNDGSVDLIIGSANGSCGCTVPDWPHHPIKPGEKAEIKVQFKSAGQKGKVIKKVYLSANTDPAQNIIALTGNVIAPE